MKKNKRTFREVWKDSFIVRYTVTVLAACIGVYLARFCAEMHLVALSVVLSVVSLVLILSAAFILIIDMHGKRSCPMTAIVQSIPAIIVSMLLMIPLVLGFATKTTLLIQQNGCSFGSIRLGYYAFMRILVGGTLLCAAYTVLRTCRIQRRWLSVLLKTCTMGGSLCAAATMIYMCLSTTAWLLYPGLFVLLVTAAILLLCWKRAQTEFEDD